MVWEFARSGNDRMDFYQHLVYNHLSCDSQVDLLLVNKVALWRELVESLELNQQTVLST